MIANISAWWARQWPQISTKIGIVLTALAGASEYASIDPRFGQVGAIAGVLLVLWNEDHKG